MALSVVVALRDPAGGFMVLINPDVRFHAASTMKVPVLMALGRRVDAGSLSWDDSVPVVNRFASIHAGGKGAKWQGGKDARTQ